MNAMMVRVRTTKGFMIAIRNFETPGIRRVAEIEEQTSLDLYAETRK